MANLDIAASASSALPILRERYRGRDAAVSERGACGCIGGDVPPEIIMAAGFRPHRLSGNGVSGGAAATRFLGPRGDGHIRSLFERLLAGDYATLGGVVIGHDVEATVQLFYVLHELRRTEPETVRSVPPLHLFDLLHMRHRTTGLYNRARARQLAERLGQLSGQVVTDDTLAAAIRVCNENRRALQDLNRRRREQPSRLMGVEALAIAGAAQIMPRDEHTGLVQALIDGFDQLPERSGVRVFITGSVHDRAELYSIVEESGGLVVGDDHDWGDRSFDRMIDEDADPFDAIVDCYQLGPPASAKYPVAERAAYTASRAVEAGAAAVICAVRQGDDAPGWDFPDQRRALEPHGIPILKLDRLPYGQEAEAKDRIGDFLQSVAR